MICLELEAHEELKLIHRHSINPSEAKQRARRLVRIMNESFPDAQIRDTDLWEVPPNLPDPDDAHVLAALRRKGARVPSLLIICVISLPQWLRRERKFSHRR